MTHPVEDELSPTLASLVRSTHAVPESASDAAQERLASRLQGRPSRTSQPMQKRFAWGFATAFALALVGFVGLPLFYSGNVAFAAVLEHFQHFSSLAMTITQRVDGRTIQSSQTLVDARGVVRTDVGEQLSVIVDPTRGRILTLLHEPKQALLTALPNIKNAQQDPLQWLDELRNFQGKADQLPETRMIDGQLAHGWRLPIQGTTLELWADDNGQPLSMRQLSGGLEIDYRFEFNQPISADRLNSDPPVGYALTSTDASEASAE